jgi:hemerythrin-like domain-containing protein
MCEYCGCQDLDVVAELTAEHDRLRELGRDLVTAATGDDLARARAVAEAMLGVLTPHTAVEEGGLFPALASEYGEQMTALTGEHREIDDALTLITSERAPASWPRLAHRVVAKLFEHILKEQDGVFPAALAVLASDQWERVRETRLALST